MHSTPGESKGISNVTYRDSSNIKLLQSYKGHKRKRPLSTEPKAKSEGGQTKKKKTLGIEFIKYRQLDTNKGFRKESEHNLQFATYTFNADQSLQWFILYLLVLSLC